MNKAIYILLSVLVLCQSCAAKDILPKPNPDKSEKPFKGVWITNVASDVLNDKQGIERAVLHCKSLDITDIFLVVWNGGYTLYPSKIMSDHFGQPIMKKFEGRDPLQEMIVVAHQHGLKVHAWFEYGFASSYNANGGHIIQKYNHWQAKDQQGNILKKNNFEWMNAFHPEVQGFVKSLVLEVVKNYNVDGVQGDDRLPALPSTGGYDEYTVQLYKNEHNGNVPPSDYLNKEWVEWRSSKLTVFLKDLYQSVKKEKPQVLVTSAPSVHPWAKTEYLQDWPKWLNDGIIDYVFPQIYRYNIEAYKATLSEQVSYLNNSTRNKFFPGVLIRNADYTPTKEFFDQMIIYNRQLGIRGEVFWFYEGLKSNLFESKK
ncbi:glycoside hydrolase family 10 protein [Sphingobacterium bovistauri]|uniref:Family 10 glycosylhydrolase n=1 Tax=Sphingobacterium bovistauri TaxID=2781959 RepID=A0ABS7Z2K7_9SPHI|nr:family 10 glycosylhydrolase [Sphingobacterium bovistauri]MCA5004393.1 family 10 glycosylhydrolase [Sphingobacterium bovistauri]